MVKIFSLIFVEIFLHAIFLFVHKLMNQYLVILNTINQNMTIIDDKLDDFNLELLKIQDIDSLTYEQKEILREEKFQQILKKKFLPYILYLRLCMET
jgi:hypothetical protein